MTTGVGESDDSHGIGAWLHRHGALYERATRHPFILSIADGTVDFAAFKRWLSQDYIYVKEFAPFLASVLLKAWKQSNDKEDVNTILGGLAALHDELAWFRKEASNWDVNLIDTVPQKANLEYCKFMQDLMQPEVEYAVILTAFWAIETVYQQSFSQCLESSSTPKELTETCRRWGNSDFKQYCLSLQKIAERELLQAPVNVVERAEKAFISVLEHEIDFWNMSSEPT